MHEDAASALDTIENRERLGDAALAAGDLDDALGHFEQAQHDINAFLDVHVPSLVESGDTTMIARASDCLRRIRNHLGVPEWAGRAAELRGQIDGATELGDLAHAAHLSFQLGELLGEHGDREDAESAYRQAVAIARQVDASDPELLLAAFSSLIHFLSPSEESIALAAEMGRALIDRDETYHPMRAAEAAYHWALAELALAENIPTRADHAIRGIAEPAIAMLDEICFHDCSQQLQWQIATILRAASRDAEADQWQAEAERYEDWMVITDQQIPGHVHLWDIHPGAASGTHEP